MSHSYIVGLSRKSIKLLYHAEIIDCKKAKQITDMLLRDTEIKIINQESTCNSVILRNPISQVTDRRPIVMRISEKTLNSYDIYPLYHEIAHLISIGEIIYENHKYIRPWGIGKTILDCETSTTYVSRNVYALNESLNDYLGAYLYENLERTPLPLYVQNRINPLKIYNKRDLLSLYLSNDSERILKILKHPQA